MLSRIGVLLLSGCFALVVSSCAWGVRLEGANPLLDRTRFETFDNLLPLVDPENKTRWKEALGYRTTQQQKQSNPTQETEQQKETEEQKREELKQILQEAALMMFHIHYRDNDGTALRNAIQDRLIAASNQRCGVYISNLKGGQAWTSLGLGVFTTMVASVSAIVTGGAARALAAVGAMSSGGRAEVDAQLFAEQTVEVIGSAIDKRRQEIHKSIKEHQSKGVTLYTLNAAIADAIQYHEACKLNEGLRELNTSLRRDVGLKRLSELLGFTTESEFVRSVVLGEEETARRDTEKALQSLNNEIKGTERLIAESTNKIKRLEQQAPEAFEKATATLDTLTKKIGEVKKERDGFFVSVASLLIEIKESTDRRKRVELIMGLGAVKDRAMKLGEEVKTEGGKIEREINALLKQPSTG